MGVLLLAATPVRAQTPPEVESFEWLGRFGGANAFGFDINSRGDVAGRTYAPAWAGGWSGFTYIDGLARHYVAPSGYTGSAESINEEGVVVGYMPHVRSSIWYGRATVFDRRTLFEGERSQALGINDDGIITGYIYLPGATGNSVYRWFPDGTLEILHNILPGNVEGRDINNRGQIVVEYGNPAGTYAAIIEPDNSVTRLSIPGFEMVLPKAINDHGHVVGETWENDPSPTPGFYWNGEGYQLLPPLPGDAGFYAMDINNLGQIVGYSRDCTKGYCDRGVLWDNGIPYELRDLASEFLESDDILGQVHGISDNGWITGGGYNSATELHEAFRMKLVTTTVNAEHARLSFGISLEAPYPNPTSHDARVAFDLTQAEHVRLSVFDLLGREVQIIVDEQRPAGRHESIMSGQDLPTGLYLIKLQTPSHSFVKTVVVAR